ncbi:uncharacterized protein N7515_003162 [Penicillium bovifimosum]|uniref:Uncharacterized protein n=1 Tax=Penicillium bovifimosum TaxID=126998 RepID=A0A9W9L5G4_9EURO|nr:uncharacterized protein N7515_003162 [Penicillium bovifimosum]KAJ5138314.1 hypothetical protein N7515_003162 [Penicillium bovifimosum]
MAVRDRSSRPSGPPDRWPSGLFGRRAKGGRLTRSTRTEKVPSVLAASRYLRVMLEAEYSGYTTVYQPSISIPTLSAFEGSSYAGGDGQPLAAVVRLIISRHQESPSARRRS